eukprot:m.48068 g.48068  ORF g.48068 m.48068 type:complete len:830 (+) comp8895_c0_seq1:180-2669(+)
MANRQWATNYPGSTVPQQCAEKLSPTREHHVKDAIHLPIIAAAPSASSGRCGRQDRRRLPSATGRARNGDRAHQFGVHHDQTTLAKTMFLASAHEPRTQSYQLPYTPLTKFNRRSRRRQPLQLLPPLPRRKSREVLENAPAQTTTVYEGGVRASPMWTVNEYAARLAPQNYRRLVEAPIELKPEAKARTSSAARTIRSLWGDYGGQPQEPDQHQPSCSLDSVPEEDPACPEFEDIELAESPMNTEDLTTNELEQLLRPWLLEKRRLNVGSSAVPPQRDRVKCTECVLTRIGGGFIRVGRGQKCAMCGCHIDADLNDVKLQGLERARLERALNSIERVDRKYHTLCGWIQTETKNFKEWKPSADSDTKALLDEVHSFHTGVREKKKRVYRQIVNEYGKDSAEAAELKELWAGLEVAERQYISQLGWKKKRGKLDKLHSKRQDKRSANPLERNENSEGDEGGSEEEIEECSADKKDSLDFSWDDDDTCAPLDDFFKIAAWKMRLRSAIYGKRDAAKLEPQGMIDWGLGAGAKGRGMRGLRALTKLVGNRAIRSDPDTTSSNVSGSSVTDETESDESTLLMKNRCESSKIGGVSADEDDEEDEPENLNPEFDFDFDEGPENLKPLTLLEQFCIIDSEQQEKYDAVFKMLLGDDTDGLGLTQEEVIKGLKTLNKDLMNEKEMAYVTQTLDLFRGMLDDKNPDGTPARVNLRQFSLTAALADRVNSLDPYIRDCVNKVDISALVRKKKAAIGIFTLDANSSGEMTLDDIEIILDAGRMKQSEKNEIMSALRRDTEGREVTFKDYLTYLPLFLNVHADIVNNTFNQERRSVALDN